MAPIWVNSLSQRLREIDLVDNVVVWPAKLSVRYHTGVIERYWFLTDSPPRKHIALTRASAQITSDIPIVHLPEPDLLGRTDADFHYVSIGQRAWEAGTVMDRALVLQRFTALTCAAGYQRRVPPAVLAEDWEAVRCYDRSACMVRRPSGISIDFRPRSGRRPGYQVMSHFLDHSKAPRISKRDCLIAAATRPRLVHLLARRLEARARRISSYAIMRMIRMAAGPRLMFCHGYAALLEHLGAESIYDPHPETGAKALACAILGIPYYTGHSPLFDDALRHGLAGFIGLNHHYLDRAQPLHGAGPHYVLVDNNLAAFDYDTALDLAGAGKRLAVYVPAAMKGAALDACAPELIVDCHIGHGSIGHYFIW